MHSSSGASPVARKQAKFDLSLHIYLCKDLKPIGIFLAEGFQDSEIKSHHHQAHKAAKWHYLGKKKETN